MQVFRKWKVSRRAPYPVPQILTWDRSSAIVTVDDRKNYLGQVLVLFVDYLVFTCIVPIYAHPQLRTDSGTVLLPLFRTMGGEQKIKEPVILGNPIPTSFPLEPHSTNGWTIPLITSKDGGRQSLTTFYSVLAGILGLQSGRPSRANRALSLNLCHINDEVIVMSNQDSVGVK